MSTAATTSGFSTVLASSASLTPFAASAASALQAASVGVSSSLVRGALVVHVDWFIELGGGSGGLMPAREIVEGTLAGGVILDIAGAAGVRKLSVGGAVELVRTFPEEGDPFLVCDSILGWRGGIDVEKGDDCPFLRDLERNYRQSANDGVKDVLGGVVGVCSVMVLVNEVFKGVVFIGHDGRHEDGGDTCDRGVVVVQESVLKGHDIGGDEGGLGYNEKSCFGSCPAVPVEKEIALILTYPSDVVRGDWPMFSEIGANDVRDDDKEGWGINGVPEHVAEEDDLCGVDGTIVRWGESDNAWAALFVQSLRVVGSRWARMVLSLWPLMVGNPSSGLGTSLYFAGGEKFRKQFWGGANAIPGGGMGFGPVRCGCPIWWYMVTSAAAFSTGPGVSGSLVAVGIPPVALGTVTVGTVAVGTVAVGAGAVVGGGSMLGAPMPEEPEFWWPEEEPLWVLTCGVVSISMHFGEPEVPSGSSASKRLFFPLSPSTSLVLGHSYERACGVPEITALEKLRPRGRDLLTPPAAGGAAVDAC